MANVPLFDIDGEFDEEDAGERKKVKALNVAIAILSVIVIVNLIVIGILTFAGDSTVAGYIDAGYAKIISLFT